MKRRQRCARPACKLTPISQTTVHRHAFGATQTPHQKCFRHGGKHPARAGALKATWKRSVRSAQEARANIAYNQTGPIIFRTADYTLRQSGKETRHHFSKGAALSVFVKSHVSFSGKVTIIKGLQNLALVIR